MTTWACDETSVAVMKLPWPMVRALVVSQSGVAALMLVLQFVEVLTSDFRVCTTGATARMSGALAYC